MGRVKRYTKRCATGSVLPEPRCEQHRELASPGSAYPAYGTPCKVRRVIAAFCPSMLGRVIRRGEPIKHSQGFSESGGACLDIGANIALTTLAVAQNPLARRFAFEPEPTNFGNLQEKIQRQFRNENVIIRQIALLDCADFVPFGLSSDGNLGDHRVVKTNHHGRHIIQVAAAPLHTLNLPITRQLAIKIDAQGAEPVVILGGLETFGKANFVALEFCPYMIDQFGGDPEIVFNHVASFERVALLKGEVEGSFSFGSAATSCATLWQIFEESRFDEDTYFDVYAHRNV